MSFDTLLKLIPNYLFQLLQLVSDPRRYCLGQKLESKQALNQSLLFFISSVFFSYVVRVPFLSDATSYWEAATVTALVYIPSAIVLGILAHISCRVVGGKGELTAHVTIFSYFSGVSVLLYALFSMAAKGIIKAKLPAQFDLYLDYMDILFRNGPGLTDPRFSDLAESQELLISMIILMVGFVLIVGWLVSIWRVYRDVDKFSTLRYSVSFILFLIFGYGTSLGLGFAQTAANVSLF